MSALGEIFGFVSNRMTPAQIQALSPAEVQNQFFNAVAKGRIDNITAIFALHPDAPQWKNKKGHSPLLHALNKSKLDAFKWLLDNGADKDEPLGTGPLPERILFRAIFQENYFAKTLVFAGADIETPAARVKFRSMLISYWYEGEITPADYAKKFESPAWHDIRLKLSTKSLLAKYHAAKTPTPPPAALPAPAPAPVPAPGVALDHAIELPSAVRPAKKSKPPQTQPGG